MRKVPCHRFSELPQTSNKEAQVFGPPVVTVSLAKEQAPEIPWCLLQSGTLQLGPFVLGCVGGGGLPAAVTAFPYHPSGTALQYDDEWLGSRKELDLGILADDLGVQVQ